MLLVMLITFLPVVEVGANINEWRQERDRLRQERDEAQSQVRDSLDLLTGLRTEITELAALMQEYNQRIIDALDTLEYLELKLLDTRIALAYAEEDLEQARQYRDAQEELFHERLRAMHEQGPIGYLDVLFQATSFTDLLVRLEHVRTIASFDRQVLEDMQAAEERVEQKVNTLILLTEQYEYEHAQMMVALAELEAAQEANAAMIYELEADEGKQALLYELDREAEQAILEELGVIDRRIRDYETEQARRAAEAARAAREAEQAARVAQLGNFGGQFICPLPGFRTTSRFGSRVDPITGRAGAFHGGIDIGAPGGTHIRAAAGGVVRTSSTGWNGGFGNMIIIDHGNGYSTLYAHNSRNRVSAGQRVTQGQHIADVGTTGRSTGNHLHFEIRRNGERINPAPFIGR